MYIKLAEIDPNFLIIASESLGETVILAPTDAKLFYNLGLTYLRIGDTKMAADTLRATINMKSNYRNARFALALIHIDNDETEKASEQLKYILENISSSDKLVKQELEELEFR